MIPLERIQMDLWCVWIRYDRIAGINVSLTKKGGGRVAYPRIRW